MTRVNHLWACLLAFIFCIAAVGSAEEAQYVYSHIYPMYEADYMMHGSNATNDGVFELSKADSTNVTLGSTRANLTMVFENVVLTDLQAITIVYGPERASRVEFWVDCDVDMELFLAVGQSNTNKSTKQTLPIEFDVDDYPYNKEAITGGTKIAEIAVEEGTNTTRVNQTIEIDTELTGVHDLFVRFPANTWSGHYDSFTLHYANDVSAQVEAAQQIEEEPMLIGDPFEYYKGLITDNYPVITEYVSEEGFVHPGIGLTKELLDNMVTHVRAGDEPWATAFLRFSNLNKSTKTNAPTITGNLNTETLHHSLRSATDVAFHQTIMYLVTGDPIYAQNARTTLRSFGEITGFAVGAKIQDSISVYKMCMTADILANTSGTGWRQEDSDIITDFITRSYVFKEYNRYNAFMNQYTMCTCAYLASAIYRNDWEDYAIGVQRLTTNPEAGGTLGEKGWQNGVINYSGDIRSQIRAVKLNAATGERLDGSHIQVVEMGRDQGHAFGSVGGISMAALITLQQNTLVDPETGLMTTEENGVNAFEFLDKRILTGANFICKYNLGYEVEYIPVYVGALEIYHCANYYTNKNNGTALDERKLDPVLGPAYYYYYYLADFREDFEFAADERTRYLYEAYHDPSFAPERDSTDWLGNGVLFFTFDEHE